MSTGFNAGIDSSDVVVRYGEEVTWTDAPAIAFTNVRLTGESFSEQKTRTRPEEINSLGYASHALTTQVQATGSLNFALSFGTYDDLLAGLVNGTFTTALTINSVITTDVITSYDGATTPLPVGGGVTRGYGISAGSTQLDSADLVAGMWVRVSGYGNAADGIYRVTDVSNDDEFEVHATAGDGATLLDAQASSGSEVFIQGSVCRNGTSFRSFYFEKQLAAALFLVYPGSFISDGNLTAQVGGFIEGSFNFLCASEASGTTTAGTGGPNLAPTGRVIDTVAGFSNLEINDVVTTAVVQGISWNVTKNNARAQFGLGQAAAQGMARGTIDVNGTMSVYFTDFTLYALYKAETDQLVSFRALDDLGAGYIFTLPAVTLMNPQIVAGGPDTDLVSEFELEGNAATAAPYTDVVFQIDKIPAAL